MSKVIDKEIPIQPAQANKKIITNVYDIPDDVVKVFYIIDRTPFRNLPTTKLACMIASRLFFNGVWIKGPGVGTHGGAVAALEGWDMEYFHADYLLNPGTNRKLEITIKSFFDVQDIDVQIDLLSEGDL